MNTKTLTAIALSMLMTGFPLAASGQADPVPRAPSENATANNTANNNANNIIAEWPERPRLGAQQMMTKYGMPDEATPERLIWNDQGPYKKITVTRMEIPHNFPKPHMDYIAHTIRYAVPPDKVDDLVAFDGSVIVDRTAGDVTARCDLEGHNILTLNLVDDIVTGEKNVEEARKAFSEIAVADTMGEEQAYIAELQFTPATSMASADPDQPTIPGSTQRPEENDQASAGSDSEILAMVVALNNNEILAAKEAEKKDISEPVADYARKLQQDHGQNLGAAMALGQEIDVTPVATPAVDQFQAEGAGDLAKLVPLNGKQFEEAFMQAMINGHTEALAMLDSNLQKADNDALKAHLTKTRSHVAMHLEQARKLKEGL